MAAKKSPVTRTAEIAVQDTTVDDITAAATKVGAPTSARVSTGTLSPNYNPSPDGTVEAEEFLPYSLNFNWTEEV